MHNELMNAAVLKLRELFGGECRIYTTAVSQGMEAPCFTVSFQKLEIKPVAGRRYQKTCHLKIRYLPPGEQKAEALNEVSEQLMEGIEYLTMPDGSLMRGMGCSCTFEEDILTLSVSYSMFLVRQKEKEEVMDEIQVKGTCV